MIRPATPPKPVGENTMKPTNNRPKHDSQYDAQNDRNSRNRMKNNAPSAGPRKLRIPPITTIATSSPANATASGSADAKRWLNTDSVPAIATTVADSTKPISL